MICSLFEGNWYKRHLCKAKGTCFSHTLKKGFAFIAAFKNKSHAALLDFPIPFQVFIINWSLGNLFLFLLHHDTLDKKPLKTGCAARGHPFKILMSEYRTIKVRTANVVFSLLFDFHSFFLFVCFLTHHLSLHYPGLLQLSQHLTFLPAGQLIPFLQSKPEVVFSGQHGPLGGPAPYFCSVPNSSQSGDLGAQKLLLNLGLRHGSTIHCQCSSEPAHQPSFWFWNKVCAYHNTSHKSGVHLLLNSLPGKHCWSVNTSKLLLPSVCRSISETRGSLELDMPESILLVLIPCLLLESDCWKSPDCLHPSSLGCSRRAWYAVSERGNVRGSQGCTLCITSFIISGENLVSSVQDSGTLVLFFIERGCRMLKGSGLWDPIEGCI